MSMMGFKPNRGSDRVVAMVCEVVECADCGGEAVVIGRNGGAKKVACPECETVLVTHRAEARQDAWFSAPAYA